MTVATLPNVRLPGNGAVHVAVAVRKVNGMDFAATKCFLNFVGNGRFETTREAATCGACTKV